MVVVLGDSGDKDDTAAGSPRPRPVPGKGGSIEDVSTAELIGCSRAVEKLVWLSTGAGVGKTIGGCSEVAQPFLTAAAGVTDVSGTGIYMGLSGFIEPVPAEGMPLEEGAGLKLGPL